MLLELIWMMLLKRRMLDSTGAVGNLFFIAPNGFWLCDGGFCAQSIFKTAIAKPVLYEGGISRTTPD